MEIPCSKEQLVPKLGAGDLGLDSLEVKFCFCASSRIFLLFLRQIVWPGAELPNWLAGSVGSSSAVVHPCSWAPSRTLPQPALIPVLVLLVGWRSRLETRKCGFTSQVES